MPKPYSLDLRERVFGYAMKAIRRAAAAYSGCRFPFVVNLVKAFRVRGSPFPSPAVDAAMPSSNRIGRFFCRRSPRRPTSLMPELAAESAAATCQSCRSACFRVGSSALAIASKTLRASEHDRLGHKKQARGMDLDAPADHAA